MDARPAALALSARRIAQADLPETSRPGFDVTRFGVGEQFKLHAPQGSFKSECSDPLREDVRLDEGQERRHLYYCEVYYLVA
jgi:hypothetical protein